MRFLYLQLGLIAAIMALAACAHAHRHHHHGDDDAMSLASMRGLAQEEDPYAAERAKYRRCGTADLPRLIRTRAEASLDGA